MSLVIRDRCGALDEHTGDAIMAFWGAPVADPLYARRAVEAALAMEAERALLNARFQGSRSCDFGNRH